MLNFVNKNKKPVSKEKIKEFGFSDKEVEEFTSRVRGSGRSYMGNFQHITSTPLLVEVELDKSIYRLTGEGYKLLQDHWHIRASKGSTAVMAALSIVGLGLSLILILKP